MSSKSIPCLLKHYSLLNAFRLSSPSYCKLLHFSNQHNLFWLKQKHLVGCKRRLTGVINNSNCNVYATTQFKEKTSSTANSESILCEGDTLPRKVKTIFRCSKKEAEVISKELKLMFDKDHNTLEKKYLFCQNLGFPKDILNENPWLLTLAESDLSSRLKLLAWWNFNNVYSNVWLFQIDKERLLKYTKKVLAEASRIPVLEKSNRVSYIAKQLEKSENEIGKFASKHKFVMTMQFEKISTCLHFLLSNKLLPHYIYTDLWVVRYDLNLMEKRLQTLQSILESHEIRPWMLHCDEEIYLRSLQLRGENKTAMVPFSSADEYLSNRLGVGMDMVYELHQRHPPLSCVQVAKLKEILDYLFSEGYSSIHICRAPRVLCHSIVTIRERMKILGSLGYRPNSLMNLCMTQKNFSKFLDKLKSSIKKYK